MDFVSQGLMRALCFFDVLEYAPTTIEWLCAWDRGEGRSEVPVFDAMELSGRALREQGLVQEERGRLFLSGHGHFVAVHEEREAFFPRKLRQAKCVAKWLSCLEGVRCVALCNTTALAHAKQESDVDFFVVTKKGTVWQTRAFATFPFKMFNRRPRANHAVEDAVCLSFFVDDGALDFSPLMLQNDVYFHHWFLSLLPLYDDGVLRELWEANSSIRERHPFAPAWVLHEEIKTRRPSIRIPSFFFLEKVARHLQERMFDPGIRQSMNVDTRVVVNDHVLKFHVQDGREKYRADYQARCQRYGISC